MSHGLTRGDLIALTASGIAAAKLHDFLDGMVSDSIDALAAAGVTVFHRTPPKGAESAEGNADATDLATSLVLTNSLKARINAHLASAGGDASHLVASAEVIAAPDATDLTTAQTLANEIKADYNTHLTEAGVHIVNDSTNDVTSADATDQGSLETLLNEIKADYNAHILPATAMNTPGLSPLPT